MRYSIKLIDRIYVKGYGFLSFAKNIDTHLSNKYSEECLNSAKKSCTDAITLLQREQFKKLQKQLVI